MTRFFIILSLLLLMSISAAAIEPLNPIEETREDVEQISGRRDLQANLVKYYGIARSIEAQLRAHQAVPAKSVAEMPKPLPRRSSELKELLMKYFETAEILETQLIELPPDVIRIDSLAGQVRNQQREILKMEKEKLDCESDCFEAKQQLIEEMRADFSSRLETLEEQYSKHNRNSVPILSVAGFGRHFFLNHGGLEKYFSYGGRVELSAYPIIRIEDFLDFWIEYNAPRISTKMRPQYHKEDIEMKWNTDLFSAGFSLKAPKIDLKYLNIILKFGAGYYWGSSELYNVPAENADWRGGIIRAEADFVRYKWFFPVDFYMAYNVYYPDMEMEFNVLEESGVYWGKDTFTSFSIGMRLTLWWHPKY